MLHSEIILPHTDHIQKRLEMIVFGEDWGAHPSSTQHIMKHLMHDHKIVWVNSLGLRRPHFNARDFSRAQKKLRNMLRKADNGSVSEEADINAPDIIHPRAISWPGNPIAAAFNKYTLGKQLDDVINQHKFDMPIFWTSLPSAIDVIDNYPNHKVIYYCGDDFRALAGVDHKPVAKMEERLAERADLIITVSETLQNRFPADKTILIEHGVDYELFSNDHPRADDFPNHPFIAGFYGSIHDWLDMDIIAEAAQSCPEWEFVFIGDTHIDIDFLTSQKNIKFLGARPHHELPSYVQHWQVSLLPFKDCEQIRACNPLKLREYLSAGRPVVTTDFPALRGYMDKVLVMKDASDLIRILKTIGSASTIPRNPDRAMQFECWNVKAKVVERHILSL